MIEGAQRLELVFRPGGDGHSGQEKKEKKESQSLHADPPLGFRLEKTGLASGMAVPECNLQEYPDLMETARTR